VSHGSDDSIQIPPPDPNEEQREELEPTLGRERLNPGRLPFDRGDVARQPTDRVARFATYTEVGELHVIVEHELLEEEQRLLKVGSTRARSPSV
jgi:hypothetical protein